jgi:hypothetical protein
MKRRLKSRSIRNGGSSPHPPSEGSPPRLLSAAVKLDWRPEPTPEEREALDRALERALAERDHPRSAWWREGVNESVFPEDEPEPK